MKQPAATRRRASAPGAAIPRAAAVIALLACTAAYAVQDCTLAGESVNPANGNTTAGKSGLMRCVDQGSGLLVREQELQSGRFMGIERFYEKGKLRSELTINEKGNRHGRVREYGPDGQLLADSTYDNGSETGLVRRFHPNGQPRRFAWIEPGAGEKAVAEFNDRGQLVDLRCGERPMLAPAFDDARACGYEAAPSRLELFNGRGVLVARASYAQGLRVRFEQVDDKGKLRLREEASPTRRFEQQFDAAGTKRRERERLYEGRQVASDRQLEFSEEGTLVRERRWTGGRLMLDASFYLNGQPKNRTEYGKAPDGNGIDETDYRDDGKVAAVRHWVQGRNRQPAGTHQTFNEAGRLIAETVYDDAGNTTRERAWDDTGKLLRDDAVFADGSRKATAK